MTINSLIDLGWSHFFQSQLALDSLGKELPFRVTAVHRDQIECAGLNQDYQPDNVQISLYHWRNQTSEASPVVGDWLLLSATAEEDYLPVKLLERKSLIKRRQSGREALIQPIAANLDTVFIVTSCNEEFSINRVERYLSIAAESQVHAVVVLTKIDLCEDVQHYVDLIHQSDATIAVETVNATDAETLVPLQSWISVGQTVALLGSSGVGKSTLTNSLKGLDEQLTGEIREADSKGRHTTTSRSIHLLPKGGVLIDSPGMRELQVVDNEAGVKATFADIELLAKQCRFRDCEHIAEPGCAVIKAIVQGKLDQRRLDNYHKLLSEQARNSESVAERRSNDKALGRFYKTAQKSAMKFKSRE